jgi:hypothetical protein
LDFAASQPSRIAIHSQCRSDGENFFADFTFSRHDPIQIWQVLPESVLTLNLAKSPVECAFELNLFNGAGSNHVFALAAVPIVEERTPSASVTVENGQAEAQALPRFRADQLQDIRLRFHNSAPAAAQVICEDLRLNVLPFEQVLDLAHFNFAAPALPPDHLRPKPLQLCRVVISEQGQKAALSQLLQIQLKRPALKPQLIFTGSQNLADEQTQQRTMELTAQSMPFVLNTWRILNDDSVPRRLQFDAKKAAVKVQIIITDGPLANPRVSRMDCDLKAVSLEPSSTVTLQPGESIDIRAVFKFRDSFAGAPVTRINIENPQALAFDELSDDHEILDSYSLSPTGVQLERAGLGTMDALKMVPLACSVN